MTTETLTNTRATASATTTAGSRAGIRVVAALAFLFGAGLVFTTGLAGSSVLHNAAHDTRHSLAFPCH
ncbi:MAG: CbtB domain-containing protein [Rhodospirillales bacterium]